ncbi:ArnT family glycosyltransferase [Hymenobacter volaticus]|uniref:DUF2079 domain-containing protein n=1 Tax=Hymenobacter volaticus TaxID=2932254 RepID=A0ABY4G5D4_9BACT|nr:DUF2079 domain-containing protein [Hymenobacter volaticus]UOQ66088.1 DUF2079 domain-containing protein [Hymenobacter volaticus]
MVDDYGVSIDEPTDHYNGAVSGKYVAEVLFPTFGQHDSTVAQIRSLASHNNNDHGVVFELPMAGLGRLFTHGHPARYYLLRHLLIFLVFVLGAWALYRLSWLRFNSQMVGVLTATLLVLSPRMFGEAFFNGKDIVFLVCFTLAMFTLACLVQQPTLKRAVLHGLATAIAIAMRLPALILIFFTVGSFVLLALYPSPTDSVARRRYPFILGLYLLVTALGVVGCWPYLWEAPLSRFVSAYRSLSHYSWPFTTLYLGKFHLATQLPWHYIPVWLLVTTPLPYVVAAIIGLASSLWLVVRTQGNYLRTLAGRFDLVVIGWLLCPVLSVIVLKSTLYDGWRHLYFIYPALLLLAVRGLLLLGKAMKRPRIRWLAAVMLVLASLETLRTIARMVQLHPYEHLYFNHLPARVVEQQFERDYWGLAFRQGVEWILVHDPATLVTVSSDVQDMLYANTLSLSSADQDRLRLVPKGSPLPPARYFLANYRWHPQPYPDSLGPEVYTIRAEGIRILSVFRHPDSASSK